MTSRLVNQTAALRSSSQLRTYAIALMNANTDVRINRFVLPHATNIVPYT